jgi:hypothetical protein
MSSRTIGPLMLALAAMAAVASAQPRIAFATSDVAATGLSPGGSVVWWGVSRERDAWITRVQRYEKTDAVADATGGSTFALGRDVPPGSLWVVLDVATGEFAAAAPPGYPRPIGSPIATGAFETGPTTGGVEFLRERRRHVIALFVRPGVGAWEADDWAQAVPGAPFAVATVVSFATMRALGSPASPPLQLLPTDTLVVIDPDVLQYYSHPGTNQ